MPHSKLPTSISIKSDTSKEKTLEAPNDPDINEICVEIEDVPIMFPGRSKENLIPMKELPRSTHRPTDAPAFK